MFDISVLLKVDNLVQIGVLWFLIYWTLRYLERFRGETLSATVLELEPRPVVQLDETLREQPLPGLAGLEPGSRIRVEVVRVEPRAGLLALRRVD